MRSFAVSIADGAPFKFFPGHQNKESKGSSKVWRVNASLTRRSVEHCTPHADGAWLNELGWSQ